MSKRILFVDDEPMVLSGIQRSLRSLNREWEMGFAGSGADALLMMEQSPFDVVITDMRMPGMDGAQLLDLVKKRFPRTIRMVLSGQSDKETILRSVGPTHQFLSKPCDGEELKQKLTRAFALRDLLENPRLKELVGQIETLPSLPSLYIAITDALNSPNTSISKIGDIIAHDMGMSVKLLQLVNSAFFGLACQVSSPKQAAALIGVENIRALVLSVHVFSEFHGRFHEDMAFLWDHSFAAAVFARAIARAQTAGRQTEDDSFTAGLLHDIGRLVLVCSCSDEYQQVLRSCKEKDIRLVAGEIETFGCSHSAVGAYLVGLWGLPHAVVEAVAWHHEPAQAMHDAFSPVMAVHVADYFAHRKHTEAVIDEAPEIDEKFLARLGLENELPRWQDICHELAAEGQLHD